ncbi:MAG TPA: radical SAM family heme chaperone HemW [Ferruginibacter sp.]|nr:radical SAM family heme chaperone HemW [Ferruginibacter sp.]HPH89278.1 radical SAM family heme chaperone HemW [Ferruginibacter sp.]
MAGIYIHIPFCRQACNYCNFHFVTSLRLKDELIAALIQEINITLLFDGNETIETIYFGGGTPSLLLKDDVNRILEALHKKFDIAGTAEVALEANPDDVNPGKLSEWLAAGINRLSVGIQSFDEAELVWMNRAHTAAESLQCIDEIKNAGFSNFSIDLIYGSPLLTNDNWKRNVDIVFEKNVPHISCYALTVEPKTALSKLITQHKKANTDPDKQSEQFLLLMQWMRNAGYDHYEISNYALPGMRSKHNSSYWSGEKYYGFGPSAHSFDGTCRRWNVANNSVYIQSLQKGGIPFEEEKLTSTQRLNEYIMTSLRTVEGLSIDKVVAGFGKQFGEKIMLLGKKYAGSNKLIVQNAHLILTDEGKLFADGIAADLFFE